MELADLKDRLSLAEAEHKREKVSSRCNNREQSCSQIIMIKSYQSENARERSQVIANFAVV